MWNISSAHGTATAPLADKKNDLEVEPIATTDSATCKQVHQNSPAAKPADNKQPILHNCFYYLYICTYVIFILHVNLYFPVNSVWMIFWQHQATLQF